MIELEEIERMPYVKYFRLEYEQGFVHMVIGDEIMASTNSSLTLPHIDKNELIREGKYPKGLYVKMTECGGFCSWCIGNKCKHYTHIETDESGFVKVKYLCFD